MTIQRTNQSQPAPSFKVRQLSQGAPDVAPEAPAAAPAADKLSVATTYTVKHTDSLWGIAKKALGDGERWPELFALNRDKVHDPELIFPGTVLKLPGKPHAPAKPDPVAEQPAAKPAKPAHHDTPAVVEHPAKPVHHDTPAVVEHPAKPAATPEPHYPTVGQYVEKRFDDAVDTTVDTLHGAGEVAFPPLLLGEIAGIKAAGRKRALDRIWDLPMDPQGKWKVEAARISDEESARANAQIANLPAVRAFSAAGDAIGDGLVWTGHQIQAGAGAVVDTAVSAGVALGEGVSWVGGQIQDGAVAAGHGIKVAGQAVADGVSWVGTQAVEVPKAAARGVVGGIGSVGSGLVRFSKWALGGLD